MFLYMSQVLQAMGIRAAIEAHRRNMPYCMGSLYWQLNDCWPVASWSGIDYFHRQKALHFAVKNAYSKILVSSSVMPKKVDDPRGVVDPIMLNKINIHITSDHLKNITANLHIELADFYGNRVWSLDTPIIIMANSTGIYYTRELQGAFSDTARDMFLYFYLTDSSGNILSQNRRLFRLYKDIAFPDPEISCKVDEIKDGFVIKLKSKAFAPYVMIENKAAEGTLSDNYFDLIPGQEKTVVFKTREKDGRVKNAFTTISLRDSYTHGYKGQ
jgi:beta-mannosidase